MPVGDIDKASDHIPQERVNIIEKAKKPIN